MVVSITVTDSRVIVANIHKKKRKCNPLILVLQVLY